MPKHAYWKGHMRLSLVTFPILVYSAISTSEKISLHKYDRDSGQRIHYQNVNDEGEIVEPDDIVKGYEYEKGSFVIIEDKEIDKLKLESKHTIDLIQFAELASIDPLYFDAPYYIAPDGAIAQEAYKTVREALKKSKKVALGQIVISNKERIVAIKACGKGLVMETLRYNYEIRKAEDYFNEVDNSSEIDEDQLALAEELINRKTAKFDPLKFKDLYQEGLKEIIDAKLEKRPLKSKKGTATPGKVTNIMEALRKSLGQSEVKKTSISKEKKAATPKKSKPLNQKAAV